MVTAITARSFVDGLTTVIVPRYAPGASVPGAALTLTVTGAIPDATEVLSQVPPLLVAVEIVKGSEPPPEFCMTKDCWLGGDPAPNAKERLVCVTLRCGGAAEVTVNVTLTVRTAGTAFGTLIVRVCV
jgi:hypothetical protein